ncbi:MAG: class I SAM-dependent methyltransferase [Verrucomicrobiota bacterium]
MSNASQAIEDNLRFWDTAAPIHSKGSGAEFYRIPAFLEGACKLNPWEPEELGDVTGKTLLHLQCHIGTDTLSWARRGAHVTGLDFSPAAITEAQALAEKINQPARFVVGDALQATSALLGEQFDILYTGRGALCWLPDLKSWARECFRLTKPGGVLYIEEIHPNVDLLDFKTLPDGEKVLTPHYDQFNKKAVVFNEEGTYADRNAKTGTLTTHCWDYTLSHLIQNLLEAGFQLTLFQERDQICFEPWPEHFEKCGPDLWTFKPNHPRFPLSYSLKLTKPV